MVLWEIKICFLLLMSLLMVPLVVLEKVSFYLFLLIIVMQKRILSFHTNVWVVSPIFSHGQYRYFVTFSEDYSRFTWVYFLHSKANVFFVFQTFVVFVETQFGSCIKTYLQQNDIISQRSCPYTP